MKQIEYLGRDSIERIDDIVNENDATRILLVTGKRSYPNSGAKDKLESHLYGKVLHYFRDFSVNPKLEDVCRGIDLFREIRPDLVIAVGGGSVLDMGKLVNILSVQDIVDPLDIVQGRKEIENIGAPLVAIPTTAGTGSQSTHFSVIYVDKVKHSVAHEYCLPTYTIIDPTLCYQNPPELAASCAMDALSQAIESYWSNKSTEKSKIYAEDSIKVILDNMSNGINGDHYSIDRLSEAACKSGKAINITTTTAAHAISYPITTYFGIPHGHAVALSLGYFFVINDDVENYEILDQRGGDYLRSTMRKLFDMFDSKNSLDCFDRWMNIMIDLGLETDFSKLGIIDDSDRKLILDNINIQRLNNNPVRIKNADVLNIISNGHPNICN